MERQPASNAGYAEEAAELLVRYEVMDFTASYAGMLHLLPAAPGRVLDVGAGTGRDAAALVARGYDVLAVEPTAAMREGAMVLHPEANIRWLDDSLPSLSQIDYADGGFHVVLVMAVWMHLDTDERAAGMPRLAGLLAPGGRLFLTLRHGPVPSGRRMFDVTPAETIALAEAVGLRTIHQDEAASRGAVNMAAGVSWTHLAFERG